MAYSKQKKSGGTQKYNEINVAPRNLSIEQRRELFLKKKKELSKDWRVVQDDQEDELVPFNMLSLDHGLRLYGMARNGTVYQVHGDKRSIRR